MQNGTRALTDSEISQVALNLTNLRDKTLFILGVRTGFRISELLSLKVSDVMQHDKVKNSITVTRANMKRKVKSRTVPLHSEAKAILAQYINESNLSPNDALFQSRKGLDAITRVQAHRILKDVFEKLNLSGKVACHSMRKTFGTKVYEKTGKDLRATQVALGHESINSTIKYLAVDEEYVQDVILSL
jgi:site-specific recombinase XerD